MLDVVCEAVYSMMVEYATKDKYVQGEEEDAKN